MHLGPAIRCLPVLLFLLVGLGRPCFAGPDWERTYGGAQSDSGFSVKQTRDGGYIVAGTTSSYGAGASDVYLIKTDGRGDTLWTRTFGGDSDDVAYSVEQTGDSGYVVAGYTKSFGAGAEDVYLIKVNGRGDTLWTRTFGGDSTDAARSVQQTSDGGYVVAGYTKSFGAGNKDIYLIRTNAQGETLWTRTYGGTSNDRGYWVQETFDGGFALTGALSYDTHLIITDAAGETLWTRTHPWSHGNMGMCVQQTLDSGFVVAGYDEDLIAYNTSMLLRYNAAGDTVWTRKYMGVLNQFDCVRQTPDRGFIVAGLSWSSAKGEDAWLMKFSASGDSQWSRTYGDYRGDAVSSVERTSDGGYIAAGYTNSFGAGGYDVYLIKADSLGNVGVAEESPKPQAERRKPAATAVRNLPLGAIAFDAMGRRALPAKPGIYFVRTTAKTEPRKIMLVE